MQCVCGRGGDSLVQPGEGSPILPCLHILSSLSREARGERREGRGGEGRGGEGRGGEGRGGEGRGGEREERGGRGRREGRGGEERGGEREGRGGREGGRAGREEGKGKGETEITLLRSMYVHCTVS